MRKLQSAKCRARYHQCVYAIVRSTLHIEMPYQSNACLDCLEACSMRRLMFVTKTPGTDAGC